MALSLRPVPTEKRIAVLPFRAPGVDAERSGPRRRPRRVAGRPPDPVERFHGSLWVVPASEVRQSGVGSAVQDQLAAEVARMLDLALSPAEEEALRSGGTTVGAAYPLYLEARGHLQRYDQTESLERAVSLFQQALQRDPEYALAYAGLAEAQWLLYRQSRGSERVDLAKRGRARGP